MSNGFIENRPSDNMLTFCIILELSPLLFEYYFIVNDAVFRELQNVENKGALIGFASLNI